MYIADVFKSQVGKLDELVYTTPMHKFSYESHKEIQALKLDAVLVFKILPSTMASQ